MKQKISSDCQIQTEKIIIKPGKPGHVVIVVGEAKNKIVMKVFLPAHVYNPAKSIHIDKILSTKNLILGIN